MRDIDRLLDRSSHISKRVRAMHTLLLKKEPGSAEGKIIYARLMGLHQEEIEIRKIVRNHPDFSYDGL